MTAPLRWLEPPTGPAVVLLDQTRLPGDEVEIVCPDVATLVGAIRRLAVRGAPLLGLAGAYGVALAAARGDDVEAAATVLAAARPTAVNLGVGVRASHDAYVSGGAPAALSAAHRLVAEDAAACDAMVRHALPLVPADARVLTHCNTGRLVSAGGGTALAVVFAAHREGRVRQLWIDETRPLLQGARLTTWEAAAEQVPHALLVDGAAGSLFARQLVDLVLVGADRIAADGSVANKIGTHTLAVLANHYGVPFVVVAPTSTVDLSTPDAAAIVIEQRPGEEVTAYAGRPIAPLGTPAYNPAFDVTPAQLVSALVTERGVACPVTRDTVASVVRSTVATSAIMDS